MRQSAARPKVSLLGATLSTWLLRSKRAGSSLTFALVMSKAMWLSSVQRTARAANLPALKRESGRSGVKVKELTGERCS